jgi:putative ABC transport system substrate-binding protein
MQLREEAPMFDTPATKTIGMPRRTFVATTLSAAVWSPVRAQSVPVIGYLGSESLARYKSRLTAFHDGLAEAGYIDGHTIFIEFAWADGDYRRLRSLAQELVTHNINVLVAPGGAEVALAAKAATSKIPIVFEMGGNPVALGIVESLSKPGGNLTGVSSLSVEVTRKRLELLRDVRPSFNEFVVVGNPRSPTLEQQLRSIQEAAASLKLKLIVLTTSDEREFDTIFAATRAKGVGGLVFTSDPYFAYRSRELAQLAARHSLPAITQSRDFPHNGGLMSYGGDFTQSHHQAGLYVGRVLKGEKPSDLPVQRVTKLELFVNLKTAGELEIAIPPAIIASADKVIE